MRLRIDPQSATLYGRWVIWPKGRATLSMLRDIVHSVSLVAMGCLHRMVASQWEEGQFKSPPIYPISRNTPRWSSMYQMAEPFSSKYVFIRCRGPRWPLTVTIVTL
jgi:hypothetical protein